VAKSGRTTGFTTGTIASVNTSVNVQYQRSCGSGKKFVVSYTNQVVINSSTFSAGGDSGSLIVSNDACHQPVALLFAGSSTTTIGNPIGEVLTKVGGALGRSVSFVGAICGTTGATAGQTTAPSGAVVQYTSKVKEDHEKDLLSKRGVIGVGVGGSDVPGEAVIVLYLDRTGPVEPNLPDQVQGIRVRRVLTDPIVAIGQCCSTCASSAKTR
jgi:hypothetical protein